MAKKVQEVASDWIGKKAPAFNLKDQNEKSHKLADYKGKWLVIYFYPKDMTPGCTAQSCGFRDQAKLFEKAGASILGISILDTTSKAKFAAKHDLNFPLLADEDSKVAEAFGVWKEKSMYGKTYMGISRETFLIGPDQKIAAHWPKAAGSESHAEEVLAKLKELQ